MRTKTRIKQESSKKTGAKIFENAEEREDLTAMVSELRTEKKETINELWNVRDYPEAKVDYVKRR